MTIKPVFRRAQADGDVNEAIDYYAREAGEDVSLEFVAALDARLASIAEHPGIGSSRYAHELDIPGLRSRSLRSFPYLVFYAELSDRIEVWRVLHAARDLPAELLDPDGED